MTPPLCDQALAGLTDRFGSPLFVYQPAIAHQQIARVRAAFSVAVDVRYAVKANPHPGLLAALEPGVDGLELSSMGELRLAQQLGYSGGRLQLSGPAKPPAALRAAAEAGAQISVEHLDELRELAALGLRPGPRITLRVQPQHLLRGRGLDSQARFGLDHEELRRALALLREAGPALRLVGLHFYAGNQCRSAATILRAWLSHLDVAEQVLQAGFPIEELNLGGGFGLPERAAPDTGRAPPQAGGRRPGGAPDRRDLAPDRAPTQAGGRGARSAGSPAARSRGDPGAELDLGQLGRKASKALARFREVTGGPQRFTLELGRYLVAPAGVYLAKVVRVKRRPEGLVVFLDGGLNHQLLATDHLGPRPRRPPRVRRLDPQPLPNAPPPELLAQRLAGPLCTPLDDFGWCALPPLAPGDRVAFGGAGAYGLSFSPWEALGHPRPPELLIGPDGQPDLDPDGRPR